ncbi:MAG: aspartate--tRNA ligase [Candidatus Omnitrophica bacterium]|nr:aspartate--tRNA ligase [Candidatus Omnitrophota bacterium]
MLRTHTCGELTKNDIGKDVTLAGWVATWRDHGGLIFIDLRDREGITQVVFNPEFDKDLHKQAESLRDEYVIQAKGKVKARPEGTENKKIPTGEIEIEVAELKLLNKSQPPMLEIRDDAVSSEDVRYTYRYLDLRRPRMQKNLMLRHKVAKIMRDYFDAKGFIEVETPIMTKSTPEGARDYLVPSRVNPGKFFALPQSPQLFKQILMVSGLDKYFQIAKCFRDEDLRADRQPEFTQLDLEMSFVEEKDIFHLTEGLMKKIFKEAIGCELKLPFDVITHKEAMARFGTDKPDRRYAMEMIDLSNDLKDCGFNVFKQALSGEGLVKGFNLKKPKQMPRSRIDSLTDYVKAQGLGGLCYFKVEDKALSGPIAKFFDDAGKAVISEKMGAETGDILLILAGNSRLVNETLSRLRIKLAREEGLIKEGTFDFLWVTEFPLFAYNEEDKRWESEHHPFTAPYEEDVQYLEKDPSRIRARSYDLVVNGIELGSGSIRIHTPEMQKRIFEAIGIDKEEAKDRFGFLTEALSYGAPPHGGAAYGLDRLITLLVGCDSIREIIAFPKTQRAICPLTKAPSSVSDAQLDELGLEIKHED